ncbi:tyrosine-type recombinase/integrase [Peribacillus asahii]|nr:tyrosine-type recombinase/integrase [Peribacillus asahii]USK62002.1 tyrosine-type recombinase/integrase [Peribacillus asahii]
MKTSEVKKISIHGLGHTNATLLMKQGINLKIVSKRLGHARVEITLDIYSHTNEEMQKKTADWFDDRSWTQRTKKHIKTNNGILMTVRQSDNLVHYLCNV